MRRLLCSFAVPLVLGLLLAQPGPAAAQCAMCKTALTNSEEGRGLSAEFNRAIVVMLMGPYLLMGAGAAYLLRGRIRSLSARAVARMRPPARSAFRG